MMFYSMFSSFFLSDAEGIIEIDRDQTPSTGLHSLPAPPETPRWESGGTNIQGLGQFFDLLKGWRKRTATHENACCRTSWWAADSPTRTVGKRSLSTRRELSIGQSCTSKLSSYFLTSVNMVCEIHRLHHLCELMRRIEQASCARGWYESLEGEGERDRW